MATKFLAPRKGKIRRQFSPREVLVRNKSCEKEELPFNYLTAQDFAAQSLLEHSGEERHDESFTEMVKNEQVHICEFSQ